MLGTRSKWQCSRKSSWRRQIRNSKNTFLWFKISNFVWS